ncbi:hypothetical protein, partial [Frankia sp. Cr1]|uniref:hypothetical protein n=1 Tax=Frankia sp. Cr1 TaxID=3073931 RepID=UPI002AD3ADF3
MRDQAISCHACRINQDYKYLILRLRDSSQRIPTDRAPSRLPTGAVPVGQAHLDANQDYNLTTDGWAANLARSARRDRSDHGVRIKPVDPYPPADLAGCRRAGGPSR